MPETTSVQCCIAGGGPAGMMLGLLLARAGVSVLVLEKHADFLRDFRGALVQMVTQSPRPRRSDGPLYAGRIFIMLNRGDYWQCGFVIAKGSFGKIRASGLAFFRDSVAKLAPFVADRVHELQDWEPIKLLTVQVDRLRQWYRPGLLCIGDAAHAMSPVGGVGINPVIQDAVASDRSSQMSFEAGETQSKVFSTDVGC